MKKIRILRWDNNQMNGNPFEEYVMFTDDLETPVRGLILIPADFSLGAYGDEIIEVELPLYFPLNHILKREN